MTIPNIGPGGIRRRRIIGVVAGGVGLAMVGLLATTDAARLWRLAALPLFWLGSVGWLQARERT
jgi:hypothetical protein